MFIRVRRRRTDDGAILIFALIAVIVMMSIATSLLTMASANFRAAGAYSDESGSANAAEGAVQTAANTIRRTLYNASSGQFCFPNAAGSLTSGSDTLSLNDISSQGARHYSSSVVCTHAPGTSSPVLINSNNRPGMAILTLGTPALAAAGEPGLSIKALNTIPFQVHGAIYSNSNIQVTQGSVVDDQLAYSKMACNAATIAAFTPAPACSFSGSTPSGADPRIADPTGYGQPSAVPTYRGSATFGSANTVLPLDGSNPPSACKNAVVTFQPGYYDDAGGLSKVMTSSGCNGAVFWFKPGNYYFDFHNGENTALASAAHVWTVDTGYLVAGTPTTTLVPPSPGPAPAIPGSCVSPIKEDNSPAGTNRPGVEFVFGGDSQFVVKQAQVEICGTYDHAKSHPPIAVYGAVSGDETQTPTGNVSMTPGAAGVVAAGVYNNVTSAAATDAVVNPATHICTSGCATWAKTGNNKQTQTFTVQGFTPPQAFPAGSELKSATVTVVHGNSVANGSTDAYSLTLALPGSGVTIPAIALNKSSTPGVQADVVNVTGAALTSLTQAVHAVGDTGSMQATYSATIGQAGTEAVDNILVNLTYRAPAYRSEAIAQVNGSTNCLTVAYTGTGGSACAAVTSLQSPSNRFYIQGTTYMPNAPLDITLNQATSQVFKFGVVARSLQVKVTGSSYFDQPIIEIPDDSPGSVVSTNVILSAYVCPGTTTCTPSGTPALRARVALVDPDPGSVIAGLRALVIQTWSEPSRAGG